MISALGFFSPEAVESQVGIKTAYRDVFAISEELSKLLLRLLRDADIDQASVKNMAINALAAKSLELFQSSIILLERGCIPAAKALCRVFIETVYKLCALQVSPDAVELYIAQSSATRLQKLKCIKKYNQKHSVKAPEIDAEVESLAKLKPKRTEPYQWALLAQMQDFHNTYYQGLSDDVHSNIESLNHYFDDTSKHLVSFGPSDTHLTLVATACHRTMLHAIEKYASFQAANISDELTQLSPRIDALEKPH